MSMTFEISPDARLLADKLNETPRGATISLADLSAVIGRDVAKCRHILYSAMKLSRKEAGAIFGTVRGVGYQRLQTAQLPGLGVAARAHIRRSAKRSARDIAAGLAKTNDIPNDVQLQANREISVLGLVEMAARDNSIAPNKEMQAGPLPVAKTAADFMKKIGAQ